MKPGEKIKQIRKAEGLTQQQFSTLTDIALGTLRNMEQKGTASWDQVSAVLENDRFEHYALWFITGEVIPEHGQVSPEIVKVIRMKKLTSSTRVDADVEISKGDIAEYSKVPSVPDQQFQSFMSGLAELAGKYSNQ